MILRVRGKFSEITTFPNRFAFEHEEARRRGVREVDRRSPPPALVVRDEDQAAKDAY